MINEQDELELNAIFEAAPEMAKMGSKKVAVVIGRFNPPTIGHYKLISQAVKQIKTDSKFKGLEIAPVVIVVGSDEKHEKMLADLSSTDDKKKKAALKELTRNPLSAAERINVMQQSGKINIVPKGNYFSAANPFIALSKIREHGFEPIAIVTGSDRAGTDGTDSEYVKILDKYFLDDSGKPIPHTEVVVDRKGEGSKEDKDAFVEKLLGLMKGGKKINDDEASGTVARRAVALGYKEEFAQVLGLSDKPALANKIFAKIEKSIKE